MNSLVQRRLVQQLTYRMLVTPAQRQFMTMSQRVMNINQYNMIQAQQQFRMFSANHKDNHDHDHDHDHDESHSDFLKLKNLQKFYYFKDFQAKKKVQMDEPQMTAHLRDLIEKNDVVLFMKGNKKMPRCGFSSYVTQVLKFYGIKEFKDVDVLADNDLREAIKTFSNCIKNMIILIENVFDLKLQQIISNWPTLPQLYVKGQFVGGCDIVKEMHGDGSLEELFVRENILKK